MEPGTARGSPPSIMALPHYPSIITLKLIPVIPLSITLFIIPRDVLATR